MSGKAPRKIATADGEPPRCLTHLRAKRVRDRKRKRAAAVESTYDITAADNHELYLYQGGRCWLCKKATGASKSLAVDHDHATDEVRGRLCSTCNQFLGRQLGDDPEAARRLVAYLSGDTPYLRMLVERELRRVWPTFTGLETLDTTSELGQVIAWWRDADEVYHRWQFERSRFMKGGRSE